MCAFFMFCSIIFVYYNLFLFFLLFFMFFFFKQKTAYEMRISDWSSDVCSSDLSSHAAPLPIMPCTPRIWPSTRRRRVMSRRWCSSRVVMVGALSGISECVCDYTPWGITSRHIPTPPGRPQMNIVVDPLAWQHAAIGGALIGVAAALLLWSSGAIEIGRAHV